MKPRSRAGLAGTFGAALLALTHSVWAGTSSQPVGADEAPREWIAYAQRVSQSLQTALAGDTETAQRFNDYFGNWTSNDAGLGAQSQRPPEPPTLQVRVWLDRVGHVERVDFDPIGDAVAEADLRSLLVAQSVGEAPPRRMKQPVVVRLSLGAAL